LAGDARARHDVIVGIEALARDEIHNSSWADARADARLVEIVRSGDAIRGDGG
jgi:hypothetical protein